MDRLFVFDTTLRDGGKHMIVSSTPLRVCLDRMAVAKVKHDFLRVSSGMGDVSYIAAIGLDIAGQKFEDSATGNGPADAAIKALEKIINKEMTLKELTIQAISKGSNDITKVHQSVEYDSSIYYGFSANTDIV